MMISRRVSSLNCLPNIKFIGSDQGQSTGQLLVGAKPLLNWAARDATWVGDGCAGHCGQWQVRGYCAADDETAHRDSVDLINMLDRACHTIWWHDRRLGDCRLTAS